MKNPSKILAILALVVVPSHQLLAGGGTTGATEPLCSSTNANTGGTSITFTAPANQVVGSTLIIFLASSSNDTGWSVPSPFSAYLSETSSTPTSYIYTGTAAASPPSTYTFTGLNGGPNHSGIMYACNNTGGLDGSGSANTGTSGNPTATGVTPSVANDMSIIFFGSTGGSIFALPSSYAYAPDYNVGNHSNNPITYDEYSMLPGNSATANETVVTNLNTNSWSAFQILLKPASTSPTCAGPPVPQGVSTVSVGSGTAISLAAPSAASSTNNFLLACVSAGYYTTDPVFTPPSGWFKLKDCDNLSVVQNTSSHLSCFTHTWNSGDTTPYVFTASTSNPYFNAFIEAISNALVNSPIDVTGDCPGFVGSSTATIAANGLTPSLNNDLDVSVWATGNNGGSHLTVDASTTALLGTNGIESSGVTTMNAGYLDLGSGASSTLNATSVNTVTGYTGLQIAIAGCTSAPTPTPTSTPTPTPTPTATATPQASGGVANRGIIAIPNWSQTPSPFGRIQSNPGGEYQPLHEGQGVIGP